MAVRGRLSWRLRISRLNSIKQQRHIKTDEKCVRARALYEGKKGESCVKMFVIAIAILNGNEFPYFTYLSGVWAI